MTESSRRDFLKRIVGGAAAAAVVASCSGGDEAITPTTAPTPPVSANNFPSQLNVEIGYVTPDRNYEIDGQTKIANSWLVLIDLPNSLRKDEITIEEINKAIMEAVKKSASVAGGKVIADSDNITSYRFDIKENDNGTFLLQGVFNFEADSPEKRKIFGQQLLNATLEELNKVAEGHNVTSAIIQGVLREMVEGIDVIRKGPTTSVAGATPLTPTIASTNNI